MMIGKILNCWKLVFKLELRILIIFMIKIIIIIKLFILWSRDIDCRNWYNKIMEIKVDENLKWYL